MCEALLRTAMNQGSVSSEDDIDCCSHPQCAPSKRWAPLLHSATRADAEPATSVPPSATYKGHNLRPCCRGRLCSLLSKHAVRVHIKPAAEAQTPERVGQLRSSCVWNHKHLTSKTAQPSVTLDQCSVVLLLSR
jgi:hypothetical protein